MKILFYQFGAQFLLSTLFPLRKISNSSGGQEMRPFTKSAENPIRDSRILSKFSRHISFRHISIRLSVLSCLPTSDFINYISAFVGFLMCATCPTHFNLVLQSHLASFHLDPNTCILSSPLFSNIRNLRSLHKYGYHEF
jgi:hypothetical protein